MIQGVYQFTWRMLPQILVMRIVGWRKVVMIGYSLSVKYLSSAFIELPVVSYQWVIVGPLVHPPVLLRSLFLYTNLSYYLVFFHFTLQDFLQHFLQGRSSGDKFPQLFSIQEYLFFFQGYLNFSLSEGQFCQIHDSWLAVFFLLAHWKYVSSLTLSSRVPDEKLADNLIEDPLYATNHFCLAIFKIFFVFQ